MSYVIINGNRYDIPEVDFDAVCELEERGINLLNMDKNNLKLATMARGLTAWVMDVDVQTASREIEAHIANGGNVVDIITRVTDAVQKSHFFAQNRQKQPQDHKGKQGGRTSQNPGDKVRQYPNGTQAPQNRAQRRAKNRKKNRGNGSR